MKKKYHFPMNNSYLKILFTVKWKHENALVEFLIFLVITTLLLLLLSFHGVWPSIFLYFIHSARARVTPGIHWHAILFIWLWHGNAIHSYIITFTLRAHDMLLTRKNVFSLECIHWLSMNTSSCWFIKKKKKCAYLKDFYISQVY